MLDKIRKYLKKRKKDQEFEKTMRKINSDIIGCMIRHNVSAKILGDDIFKGE